VELRVQRLTDRRRNRRQFLRELDERVTQAAQFIAVCRSVKTSYKMRISVRIFKSRSRPQETLIHADSLTSPSPFQY
jgi:hypothetical protein